MKTLAIWDVDDTIVMIDTSIGVKDETGKVVREISAGEYYNEVEDGTLTADQCCFFDYGCAQTFYDGGHFNPVTTQVFRQHLIDPQIDVYLITARSVPSCVDTYLSKFHEEGLDVQRDQIVFAAHNSTGEERTHTYLMKLKYYRQLVGATYNRVVGFEDNPRNLQALHEVCVDHDIPFEGHVVLEDGSTRRFQANDLIN